MYVNCFIRFFRLFFVSFSSSLFWLASSPSSLVARGSSSPPSSSLSVRSTHRQIQIYCGFFMAFYYYYDYNGNRLVEEGFKMHSTTGAKKLRKKKKNADRHTERESKFPFMCARDILKLYVANGNRFCWIHKKRTPIRGVCAERDRERIGCIGLKFAFKNSKKDKLNANKFLSSVCKVDKCRWEKWFPM